MYVPLSRIQEVLYACSLLWRHCAMTDIFFQNPPPIWYGCRIRDWCYMSPKMSGNSWIGYENRYLLLWYGWSIYTCFSYLPEDGGIQRTILTAQIKPGWENLDLGISIQDKEELIESKVLDKGGWSASREQLNLFPIFPIYAYLFNNNSWQWPRVIFTCFLQIIIIHSNVSGRYSSDISTRFSSINSNHIFKKD